MRPSKSAPASRCSVRSNALPFERRIGEGQDVGAGCRERRWRRAGPTFHRGVQRARACRTPLALVDAAEAGRRRGRPCRLRRASRSWTPTRNGSSPRAGRCGGSSTPADELLLLRPLPGAWRADRRARARTCRGRCLAGSLRASSGVTHEPNAEPPRRGRGSLEAHPLSAPRPASIHPLVRCRYDAEPRGRRTTSAGSPFPGVSLSGTPRLKTWPRCGGKRRPAAPARARGAAWHGLCNGWSPGGTTVGGASSSRAGESLGSRRDLSPRVLGRASRRMSALMAPRAPSAGSSRRPSARLAFSARRHPPPPCACMTPSKRQRSPNRSSGST
jgi:hypothetical protein